MSAPDKECAPYPGKSLGFGSHALRNMIANPFKRLKRSRGEPDLEFATRSSPESIETILEGDIIPRLMLAHALERPIADRSIEDRPIADRATRSTRECGEIDTKQVMDFARLPMRHEAPDLIRQVDRFLERGFSVEEVFVDLLAPAARHLGDLWSRDECDFIDVTMGLWRLQEVLREISLRVPSGPSSIGRPIGHPIGQARSAVFCPVPGDVHTFGAQMIEEVFARAGWQSEALLRPHRRELLDYMASRPVDAIGLTVSHNHSVSVLARLIKAIRSVAVKPNLVVLVGGHMINCNPALVAEIGADGTGEDAKAALAIAARLVDAAQTRARAIA